MPSGNNFDYVLNAWKITTFLCKNISLKFFYISKKLDDRIFSTYFIHIFEKYFETFLNLIITQNLKSKILSYFWYER